MESFSPGADVSFHFFVSYLHFIRQRTSAIGKFIGTVYFPVDRMPLMMHPEIRNQFHILLLTPFLTVKCSGLCEEHTIQLSRSANEPTSIGIFPAGTDSRHARLSETRSAGIFSLPNPPASNNGPYMTEPK